MCDLSCRAEPRIQVIYIRSRIYYVVYMLLVGSPMWRVNPDLQTGFQSADCVSHSQLVMRVCCPWSASRERDGRYV